MFLNKKLQSQKNKKYSNKEGIFYKIQTYRNKKKKDLNNGKYKKYKIYLVSHLMKHIEKLIKKDFKKKQYKKNKIKIFLEILFLIIKN